MCMERVKVSNLTGNSSRSRQASAVTPAMVKAPVHVAVALWDVPWRSAESGLLNGWVITLRRHHDKAITTQGETFAADPVPEVLAAVAEALRGVSEPTWLVTGTRQNALRQALVLQGYAVSSGFSEKNHAAERCRRTRLRAEQRAKSRSKKAGQIPKAQASQAPEAIKPLWLPQAGKANRTRSAAGKKLFIGTDASTDQATKAAICFVASTGDYQLRTRKGAHGTNQLEFEAITMALEYALTTQASEVTIFSDSQVAVDAIRGLARRADAPRARYGISAQAQRTFVALLAELQSQRKVTVRRVLGHAGHSLNEAADMIAYMATRASIHPEKSSGQALNEGIAKALAKARRAPSAQGAPPQPRTAKPRPQAGPKDAPPAEQPAASSRGAKRRRRRTHRPRKTT